MAATSSNTLLTRPARESFIINFRQKILMDSLSNDLPLHLEYSPSSPSTSSIVSGLHNIILKQQAIISALLSKLNAQETQGGETIVKLDSTEVKLEINSSSALHQDHTLEDYASETTEESFNETKAMKTRGEKPKIIRQNGFKPNADDEYIKAEEEESDISLEKAAVGNSSRYKKPKNFSKAKHLWVNYGRRILEYAIGETEGVTQARIKHFVGKLNSKKDFEKAFLIKGSDSSNDKAFKTLLGKIGIDFVKNKASPTFETSKYKQEMITQRHTVAAWIERLIST